MNIGSRARFVGMGTVLLMLVLLCGCAVARAPKRLYQFAYCNKMEPDGKHCQAWATPCGTLDCKP